MSTGLPLAGVVTVAALFALVVLAGCGGDDDEAPGQTTPAATTASAATTAPAVTTAPAATTGGEVVRLIVTPAAGIAPEALGEQLVDEIGPDLVVVDEQRATLVVTVPADRVADVETAPGVAAVQSDVAEPAG